MAKYLLKRFARSLFTLFLILTIVFILVRQMPIEGYFSNFEKMTEQQIQNGLESMGLTQPMWKQLLDFYTRLLHGDLGTSRVYYRGKPVWDILQSKLPISVQLGSLAILFSMLVGLPMGTLMAKYKDRFPDHLGTVFIVLIQAVPAAVYYLFIQLYGTELMGLKLRFDPGNWVSWVLPVFSLALGNIAYYAMWLRRYMVDESNKDYVTLARIKGASEGQIMFRHIFRNAFVPMAQYLPTSFLNTVIGSIYIESIWSIKGMGGLLVDVIHKQDNEMILGIVLIFSCVGILGLMLGDLLMTLFDPRISFTRKAGEV